MDNIAEIKKFTSLPSTTIGVLSAFDENNGVLVRHDYHNEPVKAFTTLSLDSEADTVGKKVLLSFIDDDPLSPVVMGFVSKDINDDILATPVVSEFDELKLARNIELRAANRFVISCGKSQIIMDRFGKIVIKGANLLSRATSRNRIKGGSISLN